MLCSPSIMSEILSATISDVSRISVEILSSCFAILTSRKTIIAIPTPTTMMTSVVVTLNTI